jgi:hypothetical protein
MTAAVDCSDSSATDFTQSLGRQDGPEVTGLMRTGFRAICSSGDEAVILQQLIYWTRRRQSRWVQLSAGFLGEPLAIPARTVRDCLARLAEAGFIEAEQRRPGASKWYRIDIDAVLDALRERGFDADADAVFGHPGESRQPPRQNSPPPPQRDSPPIKEEQEKEDNKEVSEVVDGRVREASAELSEADGDSSATTPNPPDSPSESPSPDPPDDLDDEIHRVFKPWAISEDQARHIRETLQTLGLTDNTIREYIRVRACDFAGRNRTLSRAEVVRYVTDRQDLEDRGYIRPIQLASQSHNATPDTSSAQTNSPFVARWNELVSYESYSMTEAETIARQEAAENGWEIPDDFEN